MEQRFAYWRVFDYRTAKDGYGNPPEGNWGAKKLGPYLDQTRKVIQWTAESLMDAHFKESWNGRKEYKDFTYGPDKRKIESLDEFHQYVQIANPRNPEEQKELREMVSFVVYGMWRKNHVWAYEGEKLFMEAMGWEYAEHLSNGNQMKRKQRGNCIKSTMVKKCGEKTDAIRLKYEELYQERMYVRDMFSPALTKLKSDNHVPATMKHWEVDMEMLNFDKLEFTDEKEKDRVEKLFDSCSKYWLT